MSDLQNKLVPPSTTWLNRMATDEEQSHSTSVGGLASELGMYVSVSHEPVRVFGKFVQLSRRQRGLTLEHLAERAKVDLAELIAIELSGEIPTPRTVFQLANVLRIPTARLMALAGLAEEHNPRISDAVVRFAARAEPTAQLTSDEKEALDEFVKVLVETTDGA